MKKALAAMFAMMFAVSTGAFAAAHMKGEKEGAKAEAKKDEAKKGDAKKGDKK